MIEDIITDLLRNTIGELNVTKYRNYCAAQLARLYFKRGDIQAERADYEVTNKDAHKSHASLERHWEATDRGKELLKVESTIKAYQSISDALEGSYWDLHREKKEAERQET